MDFAGCRLNTIKIDIMDSMGYWVDIIDISKTIMETLELFKKYLVKLSRI